MLPSRHQMSVHFTIPANSPRKMQRLFPSRREFSRISGNTRKYAEISGNKWKIPGEFPANPVTFANSADRQPTRAASQRRRDLSSDVKEPLRPALRMGQRLAARPAAVLISDYFRPVKRKIQPNKANRLPPPPIQPVLRVAGTMVKRASVAQRRFLIGERVLPKTNCMAAAEGQRPNSYQPWPPAKVSAQTNPERQRRGSLCPRPKETWNLPHPASRGCINTVTMSLVGMARCAVTVAERSVRRRNESSESPGFGQRAERLNKRARFANSIAPPDAALGGADGAARHPYLSWQGQC